MPHRAALLAAALLAASGEVADGKCCCCATWTDAATGRAASGLVSSDQNAEGDCTGLGYQCWSKAMGAAKKGTSRPGAGMGAPDSWQGHTFQAADVNPKTNKAMSCRDMESGAKPRCNAAEQDHLEADLGAPKQTPPKGTLVMDFDCTLSEQHLYKTSHPGMAGTQAAPSEHQKRMMAAAEGAAFNAMPPEARWKNAPYARWVMGGDNRIQMLRSKLSKMRAEGVKVEVCTWSEPERVESILRLTGLDAEIDRIHGRQNCKKEPGAKGVVCEYYALTRRPGAAAVEWESQAIPQRLTKKQDWIKHLAGAGGAGPVMFVDDTAENYKGLAGVPQVTTFENSQFGMKKDGLGLTGPALQAIEQQMVGSSGGGGAGEEEPLYMNHQQVQEQEPLYMNQRQVQQQLRGGDVPPPVPKRNH